MKTATLDDKEWAWVISILATALAYQNPTFLKLSQQLAGQVKTDIEMRAPIDDIGRAMHEKLNSNSGN